MSPPPSLSLNTPPAPPLTSRAPARTDSNASAGEAVQLRLSEQQWRSVTSLLAGAKEMPEEPLEDLDAAAATAPQ